MIYQVLARANAQAAWEPYQAMTRDPLHALMLLQKASRSYEEVSVIQAESAHLLREQVRRLRLGEPTGHEASATPSLSATPRISVIGATIESQRWAIEQGPGGDHDTPYHFEAPISEHTLRRWTQLLVEARRLDAEADTSASAETLAEVELLADTSAPLAVEATAEPTTVRSERVN
jgi:hypothetical protein